MAKTISVSDETYDLIKDQLGQGEKRDLSCIDDLVDGKWFFRTVTYHLVGEAVSVFGNFIKLEDASWVADSGRFMNAIKSGELEEVEPVGDCFVNLDSVVDFFPWKHSLPEVQK